MTYLGVVLLVIGVIVWLLVAASIGWALMVIGLILIVVGLLLEHRGRVP